MKKGPEQVSPRTHTVFILITVMFLVLMIVRIRAAKPAELSEKEAVWLQLKAEPLISGSTATFHAYVPDVYYDEFRPLHYSHTEAWAKEHRVTEPPSYIIGHGSDAERTWHIEWILHLPK